MYKLLQGLFEAVFLGQSLQNLPVLFPKRKFCRAGLSAISFAVQKDAAPIPIAGTSPFYHFSVRYFQYRFGTC